MHYGIFYHFVSITRGIKMLMLVFTSDYLCVLWQFVGNKTKNKASIPDLVCEDEETGENTIIRQPVETKKKQKY